MKTECDCEQNEFDYHEEDCVLVQKMLGSKHHEYPIDGEVEDGVIYVLKGSPPEVWCRSDGYYFQLPELY